MAIERIHDDKKGELDRLIRTKGKHSDGGGLYLQVASPGAASWVWRHKERWKSIGPASAYTIREARDKAFLLRKEVHENRDPFELLRRTAKRASKTFGAAMEEYLAAKSPSWVASNRARELQRHRFLFSKIPDFVALPLNAIDQDAKNKALATWNNDERPKNRKDVGFYIEAIIRYAETGKLRIVGGASQQRHHEAMPYAAVPDFYKTIASIDSDDARSLAFLILTGARTDEVIGRKGKGKGVWLKARPTWREITEVDGQPVWTVPGRLIDKDKNYRGMKGKKDHKVPLSPATFALLGERGPDNVPLFKVSSQNAMLATLRKNGGDDYTVHGFRSSFSDWSTESAGYDADVTDMCIAHPTKSKPRDPSREAYQRSDMMGKRREIMQAWSDYVTGQARV